MRGTPIRCSGRQPCGRFIPAHAGNSPLSRNRTPRRAVHPRACGELNHAVSPRRNDNGSSPRMRGTRHDDDPGSGHAHRFIPAHAGNSRVAHSSSCSANGSSPRMRGTRRWPLPDAGGAPVHPRACGELVCVSASIQAYAGSSPRMRGTRRRAVRREPGRRFIPAHAGNSHRQPFPDWLVPVHPRACGELGRGAGLGNPDVRFIPAHAGNSLPGKS